MRSIFRHRGLACAVCATAFGSAVSPGQVTSGDENRIAQQQQIVQETELWLARLDAAQRSGDCDQLERIETIWFRNFDPQPADFSPEWVREVTRRRDEIRARGCAGRAPGAAWLSGEFETDFGRMQLSPGGGIYDQDDGRIRIVGVRGDVAEGTWEESDSNRRCDDGRFRGRIRFTRSEQGFTGTYGYCDDEPTMGSWNGRRVGSPAPTPVQTATLPSIPSSPQRPVNSEPPPEPISQVATDPRPALASQRPASPPYVEISWTETASRFQERLLDGQELRLQCPAAGSRRISTSQGYTYEPAGSDPSQYVVFGTGAAYGYGSSLCGAAVHAGIIGWGGGRFRVAPTYVRGYEAARPRNVVAGFVDLPSSTANGVRSRESRQRRAEIFRVIRPE